MKKTTTQFFIGARAAGVKKVFWNHLLIILSFIFSTGFIFLDKQDSDTKPEDSLMLFNKTTSESTAPITIKVCYNSDSYGMGGTNKTYADDKLLNLNNWGPSGTDTRYQFELYNFGFSTITEAALIANGCQIFYVGGTLTDARGFSPATTGAFNATEKEVIKNWAVPTDKVIIAFQGTAVYMGGSDYVASGSNRNPNTLTDLGESVISGSFGQSSSFNQFGGVQGNFTTFPSTACVLTEDANGNPTGLINSITGDFYLADFGILQEGSGLTNNNGISSNTDMLFANLMSSAATIVVEGPTNACNLFSCPAGDVAPILTSGNVASTGEAVNLPTLFIDTPPNGTALTWHSDTTVADSNYIGNSANYFEPGVVFAAFRAHDGSCYSPATPVNVAIDFPDLTVSVSPVNGTSLKSETQTYTVTVTNNGAVSAPEALIKVPLPSERQLVMTIPSAGFFDGGTEIWNVGQLTTGQSETLEVTIRVQ